MVLTQLYCPPTPKRLLNCLEQAFYLDLKGFISAILLDTGSANDRVIFQNSDYGK